MFRLQVSQNKRIPQYEWEASHRPPIETSLRHLDNIIYIHTSLKRTHTHLTLSSRLKLTSMHACCGSAAKTPPTYDDPPIAHTQTLPVEQSANSLLQTGQPGMSTIWHRFSNISWHNALAGKQLKRLLDLLRPVRRNILSSRPVNIEILSGQECFIDDS